MSEYSCDCCFTLGREWFRYRVGAVIISDGYALFAANDRDDYYYTVGGGVHMGEYSRDAVLRETMEETGLELKTERPLCLIENFFDGDGSLDGLQCHTIELYYLMKPAAKTEIACHSTTGGSLRISEKMHWLPIDRLGEYDIRPKIVKKLAAEPPERFEVIVNEERKNIADKEVMAVSKRLIEKNFEA